MTNGMSVVYLCW